MQVLIGSRAVKNIFSDYRECNDWDYLVNEIPDSKEENAEYYIIPPLSEYLLQNELDKNVLYTLKVSHSFWNINFEKTVYDIRFLKHKGSEIIEPLYKELYSFWETVHGKKKVYLNETNEDFFTSRVDRIIEHDTLHEILAYYDEPMFNKLKKDLNKAWISKDMFTNLSYEDKLKTCREELYVIATERFLIPNNFKMNSLIAYKKAVRLLVTSLSKGWFPLFIIENIEALDKPDIKYSDKVKNFLTTKENTNGI